MGLGFEHSGGHLTTIEIVPQMTKATHANVKKMWLEKSVAVVERDALKVLPKLEGKLDFIFIDAVKSDYLKYLEAIEPNLKPGAVIIADNVIQSAAAMQDLLGFMEKDRNYHMAITEASDMKRDGMAVIHKVK